MKTYIKVNGAYIQASEQQAADYLKSSFIRDGKRWAVGFAILFTVIFLIILA